MMQEITRDEIDILLKLQQAESEAVRIKAFLKEVDNEKAELDSQLLHFEKSLEKCRKAYEKSVEICRESEAEIHLNDDRIAKSNETLKKVKTNKAYQTLLREIDDNKKRKTSLENFYLEKLEEQEAQEKLLKEKEADFLQLSAKIRSERDALDEKDVGDRELLENYISQREEIGKKLSPAVFTQFKEISRTSGGLAVVQVVNEVCRGCFMNIPPQLYIEVQRCKFLILCPQCNRILYYQDNESDTVEVD